MFHECKVPALLICDQADLRKFPELSLATKQDWRKVANFLDGAWPQPWPKCHLLGADPNADKWWFRSLKRARHIVFDVETEQLPDGTFTGYIIQVGLYPAGGGAPAIWDRLMYPDWDFTGYFRDMIRDKPMVAHNTAFDVGRIWDNFGIPVWEYRDLHDTILMHHLLWSEFAHGLEFLSSVYSEHPKAKHLGVGNYDYLIGDVVATNEAYEAMLGEFAKDPASARLYYQELKLLLPIIVDFMHRGVLINQDFVVQCLNWMPQQMEASRNLGEAYVGYPLSLESGDQLRSILDETEDIFGAAKAAGGVVKKSLTDGGKVSFDKDTINPLRAAFVPLEYNEDLTPDLVMQRLAQGAHPLLEAKALWIAARVQMSNYIRPLLVPLEHEVTLEGEVPRYYTKRELHVGAGAPQVIFRMRDEACSMLGEQN